MRAALATLRDETAEFVRPYRSTPVSNSVAETDALASRRPESVHTLLAQTFILVEVVADQLTAFSKTITEPFETIAPWTCARSLLEAASLACWLLDPKADPRTRLARSLALRYEGLSQQMKWARSAGKDPSLAQARLDEVARVGEELGYSTIMDDRNRRVGVAMPMPSVTAVIGSMVDEEPLYRLLSAFAHGHAWAIQQLSFRPAVQVEERVSEGVRLIGMEKAPNINGMALLIVTSAEVFSRTLFYQTLYLGWDNARLVSILERGFDGLNAADRLRFWRIDGGTSGSLCEQPGR